MNQLHGIHHITSVSANISENVKFYTETLGLRLVKKSVNQDDVSAYHLFYADKAGSPGTDMTFFDWPHIGRDRRGTDSIVGTTFRVASREALEFWATRLAEASVEHGAIMNFAGREMLPFEDPEGQRLYLVNDQGADFEGEVWLRPDIPEEFTLRGFYSVILSIASFGQLIPIFTQALHFTQVERATWIDGSTDAAIFTTKENGGPGTEIWLLEQPDLPQGHLGAGGTHHVAFRVEDIEQQKLWREGVVESGLHATQLIDRFWFSSIYFRVSNGILFEIATDGPGFAIDEDPDALGEKLVLPPFLENRREQIEASLTPIEA
ncbi:MAG: ring-cleaving dioxygenase [Anaerolineales bacterium]|jgi:glyoxalase family protein